jgi:RNA polymerase sigma-70 factor (ECF subfamily)
MAIDSEREHLQRLRKGDLDSFKWIYERYHEKVYGYCLRLIDDHPAAQEITEDVFVRLWEKREIVDASLTINGLLLKITKDFAWNYLKKTSRQARQRSRYALEQHRPPPAPSIESELIFRDYLDIAEAAIRQLPEKRQLVFNLRYKNGLDNREIAHRLNISETTVRVHLLKATQFLRSYLASHPEIPLLFIGIYLL